MKACAQCGRPIYWDEHKLRFVDARMLGDDIAPITGHDGQFISHFMTCPIKIQERIRQNCTWCRLEKGNGILTMRSTFEYTKCDKHADEKEDVQYHGVTLKRDNKTLRLMYSDALKTRKREKRKVKKGQGTAHIEAFLSNQDNELL